ncbi:MAG: winged helix-turn-helix domain-containing protein [Gammaproteobacteria bacterium]|jgi:DNA-binding winged helix-turn-helix (wHTH) protein/TolB-like protein/Tfp pilus assembly protein PilF
MDLDAALRKGFRLGEWAVKPIEGLLEGTQGTRHLQPKTMDVLVCLAAQPGQVVTRDELIDRVWAGTVVSDEPLTRCIHEIRRALGDHRDEPAYIKTIPKRGYQLVQAVTAAPDLGLESVPQIQADKAGLFWQVTRQRVLWVGAAYAILAWLFVQLARFTELRLRGSQALPDWLMPALAVIVLLGFPVAVFFAWVRQIQFDEAGRPRMPPGQAGNPALLLWTRRGIDTVLVTLVISFLAGFALDVMPGATARPLEREAYRLAVMPFSASPANGVGNWLGKGIAEDLRLRLTNLGSLAVSSRNRAFRESIQGLDPQQIGQELGVQYLLQGAVVRGPDNIHIKAELVDTVTGLPVWAHSFTQPAALLFDAQQDIVSHVAAQLNVEYVGSNESAGWPQVLNVAAYDSYLRGRNLLRDARDAETAAMAAAWFKQASTTDPHLAMARVGLCEAGVRELEFSGTSRAYGFANQACAETILQSPDLPAAHLALGNFYRVSGLAEQAIDEFEWVLDQDRASGAAWFGLARAYWDDGDPEASEQAFRTAFQYEPDDIEGHEAYTAFLLAQDRYVEAVAEARDLVALDRDRVNGYDYLAEALFMTGDFDGAIQASRQVLSRDLERYSAVMRIAHSYYYRGDFERARGIYGQAAKLQPGNHFAEGGLAVTYEKLDASGKSERSAASFRRAMQLAENSLAKSPEDPLTRISLAYYCAALLEVECATKHRVIALDSAPENFEVHYLAALVYALLGDPENATAETRRALELGYPQILVLTDPRMSDYWSGQRFATAGLGRLLIPEY